jgi:hypothetical protein
LGLHQRIVEPPHLPGFAGKILAATIRSIF